MKEFFENSKRIYDELKSMSAKLLLKLPEFSLQQASEQLPSVLFVGEFNAGKSSLINSGLGEDLLPTGVTPTTAILTFLENGPFQIRIKALGEKEAIKLDPGKNEKSGFGMPDEKFDWQSFRNLITDPAKLEKLEKIEIRHPSVPKSFNLIDSPGINDLSKSRAEIVYGVIPSSEIIVFVISALKPFSESEKTFIEEKLLAADLKKIIFVLNRMDEIEESEHEELFSETKKAIVESVNKSYSNLNSLIGQELYQPISEIELLLTSALIQTPVDGGTHLKNIGFATKSADDKMKSLASGNRDLWKKIITYSHTERNQETRKRVQHFLRKNLLRIQKAVKSIENTHSSEESHAKKLFSENSEKIRKLRESLKRAELRIQQTEDSLKSHFSDKINSVINSLASINRLSRDPSEVNSRLKELYEYLTNKMKITFDLLYSELGKEFSAIIDERAFLEERKFEIEYDLSNLPSKVIFSLNFAYLAAIFFGINIGLFAGAVYLASQIITNQRSIKDYLLSATVAEEKLTEVKDKIKKSVFSEIEYATDYVKQSLIQRIDVVQTEIKNLLYNINRPVNFDLNTMHADIARIHEAIQNIEKAIEQ
ncbi:MAG: dynamin family protein [Candidatus Riflebacteria bacterium]|nr:dynamin family protein [Candidatus Riflebacteria bacterium]